MVSCTCLIASPRWVKECHCPDGGRGQPWSPMAALDAALDDWPEDQPTRDLTLAAAEADLLAVLKDLFPPDDPGHEAPAS